MDNKVSAEKRFSKINGKVCKLKVKVFSSDSIVQLADDPNPVKSYDLGETKTFSESSQKSYSTTSVKERLRYAKFSPRQQFKRVVMDYKQTYQSIGSRLSDEDFKLLRGLFLSDMMNIMNRITPDILEGKQINTLLGVSAFGKELRLAATKLQMPYRIAFNEEKRNGAPTRKRYQDIQKAYNEFMRALLNYVFPNSQNPVGLSEALGTVTSSDENGGIKITQ